jgi:hypothetical protein
MDEIVWMGMTVLAVVFAVTGPMKLQYASYVRRKGAEWAVDVGPARTRLIGMLETLGAIGLVWPLATRTLPWLSVAAGLGLALLMAGATLLHVRRGESRHAATTGVLGLLALFVTIGIVV